MIQKNVLSALVAGVVLAGSAFAASALRGEECAAREETCSVAHECPVAQKVTALLASWESVTAEARTVSLEERREFGAEVASVAQKCPVGSRMAVSMSAVRDVLGTVVASQQASAEHCPLERAESSAACAEGKALKAARNAAIGKLYRLASYTAGITECATAESCDAALLSRDTRESCDEGAVSCPIRIASRIGALKASWADAREEAQALSAQARGEIRAGFAALAENHEAVRLVPASVLALAEGFEALDQLNGRMGEWAQANPEVLAQLSESARRTYRMEVSLLEEARGLLERMTEVMQTMKSSDARTARVGSNG